MDKTKSALEIYDLSRMSKEKEDLISEAFLICALALPAATDFKPPLSHADLAVIGFVVKMTQAQSMDDILFINKPWWEWSEVRAKLIALAPGGFVFIEGRQSRFHKWFMDHGWMHFPFMWRKYHIYKKPFYKGLSLTKGAA